MGHAVIRLLLARHGVTEWNQGGRYQGHQDVPLSETGRAQAKQLGERLRSETISTIYTSDLARARETAEIAMSGRDVPVMQTQQLREMSFGAWEGLRYDQVAEKFPAEWDAWVRNPVESHPTDGESLEELRSRLSDLRTSVLALPRSEGTPTDHFSYRGAGEEIEETSTLLFVCHGGTVRVLLTVLLDIPTERYWRFGVRPASLSILELYPEGAIAEVIGDTSHLS